MTDALNADLKELIVRALNGPVLAVADGDARLFSLDGRDIAPFLGRMTTQVFDRGPYAAGVAVPALWLTAQGRPVQRFDLAPAGDRRALAFVDGAGAAGFAALIDRYTITEDVRVAPLAGRERFVLFGAGALDAAHAAAAAIEGAAAGPLAGLDRPAAWLATPEAAHTRVVEHFWTTEVPVVDADTFDALRVHLGIVRFGPDFDDAVNAMELGLFGRAIIDGKGCYPGQEVVEKVVAVGGVNRLLVRLALTPRGERPRPGMPLTDEAGRPAGRLGTAAPDVTGDGLVALGLAAKRAAKRGARLLLPDGGRAEVTAVLAASPSAEAGAAEPA